MTLTAWMLLLILIVTYETYEARKRDRRRTDVAAARAALHNHPGQSEAGPTRGDTDADPALFQP